MKAHPEARHLDMENAKAIADFFRRMLVGASQDGRPVHLEMERGTKCVSKPTDTVERYEFDGSFFMLLQISPTEDGSLSPPPCHDEKDQTGGDAMKEREFETLCGMLDSVDAAQRHGLVTDEEAIRMRSRAKRRAGYLAGGPTPGDFSDDDTAKPATLRKEPIKGEVSE